MRSPFVCKSLGEKSKIFMDVSSWLIFLERRKEACDCDSTDKEPTSGLDLIQKYRKK